MSLDFLLLFYYVSYMSWTSILYFSATPDHLENYQFFYQPML